MFFSVFARSVSSRRLASLLTLTSASASTGLPPTTSADIISAAKVRLAACCTKL